MKKTWYLVTGFENPEPATRNPEPGTRNPEPGTRNPVFSSFFTGNGYDNLHKRQLVAGDSRGFRLSGWFGTAGIDQPDAK